MKIVFVIVSMTGGGSERVISILANRFVHQGIDVTIMMTAGDEVAYQLDKRIMLKQIGGKSGGSIFNRYKRIVKMRSFFKLDKEAIIISFGPDTSLYTVLSVFFLSIKLIISERNDPAICPYPYFLRNLIYRRAQKLLFQTQAASECFPKYLKKKGCVIGNPLSEDAEKLEPDNSDITNDIVAVGRLEPQKNYPLLLKAFTTFTRKIDSGSHSQYNLIIYGNGSLLEELQKQAQDLGIADKVTFAGFQTDVLIKIRNSAMYVLSSDYEGMSNSLLEAMGIGLPVIATDCPIGGSAELIKNGVNGLLIPVGDEIALADAMWTIASNPQSAKNMGKEAIKVKNQYSAGIITEKWLDEIKSII